MQPSMPTQSSSIQLLDDLSDRQRCTRARTETFIHAVFEKFYGADVQQFLPYLLSLTGADKAPLAALGFRPAGDTVLFLENYLQRPVEQVLSTVYKQPINRSDIVEVGNLAIGERGAARALIVAMTAFLFAARYKWCVFTIGRPLINTFARMGIELQTLSAADNSFMSAPQQASWGNYYEQKPQVMSCRVEQAYQVLIGYVLGRDALRDIWLDAQQAGHHRP